MYKHSVISNLLVVLTIQQWVSLYIYYFMFVRLYLLYEFLKWKLLFQWLHEFKIFILISIE